jgi:hypothetical protein
VSDVEQNLVRNVAEAPPVTGHHVIDAALGDLRDLADQPPAEQYERLATTLDVLTSVLDSSRDQAQVPIPGVR